MLKFYRDSDKQFRELGYTAEEICMAKLTLYAKGRSGGYVFHFNPFENTLICMSEQDKFGFSEAHLRKIVMRSPTKDFRVDSFYTEVPIAALRSGTYAKQHATSEVFTFLAKQPLLRQHMLEKSDFAHVEAAVTTLARWKSRCDSK